MTSVNVISPFNQRHLVNVDSTLMSTLRQRGIWVDIKNNFVDNLIVQTRNTHFRSFKDIDSLYITYFYFYLTDCKTFSHFFATYLHNYTDSNTLTVKH